MNNVELIHEGQVHFKEIQETCYEARPDCWFQSVCEAFVESEGQNPPIENTLSRFTVQKDPQDLRRGLAGLHISHLHKTWRPFL